MKKIFTLLLFILSFGYFNVLNAQTVNEATTANWLFDLGTAGQVATYTGATADYFGQDYVSIGSNWAYKDARLCTYDNFTYTRFQPFAQSNAPTAVDAISFNIRPKKGLAFTPTSISFYCMRYGTDGGSIDVAWKSSDGTETSLQTAIKPNRDNNTAGGSMVDILIPSSVVASDGECSLIVYYYGLGNTKQAGLANVKINGKIVGTPINVTTYTLASSVYPEGAGSIATSPVGTVFDAGTSVTLTANRNFGYKFSHWANASNVQVSTANPYTFTINANTELKAVYSTINTYALNVNVAGGANPYMVTVTPAGNVTDGVTKYEQGAIVVLTANENPLLTFTNWSGGQTSTNLSITMNSDQNHIANYSAVDYIVGWDFYKTGNGGRIADFYSKDENEASAIVLRTADGTSGSWLDKSQMAAGGYEGQPAAVNWKPLADKYYYQTSFDATNFTDMSVQSSMLFNYNAYSKQRVEYSLDGVNFTLLDVFDMSAAKTWYTKKMTIPAIANHASKVYIRWIPDYTSAVVGTESANDGTAISGIYVFGNEIPVNDGVAPVLLSTIPASNATGASTTGKIVLTFDEKVKVPAGTTATIGSKIVDAVVSGKTITFSYTGLEYSTKYTFTLNSNKVSDLTDNIMTTGISFDFSTLYRPKVTKQNFNFVVGVDGDFKAALAAATAAASTGKRFYIFFPDGEYNVGENTGDANQMTTIAVPKLSIIGQSSDKVIVYNKSIQESINSTATLYFTSASNMNYLQDISLLNKMDYRTGTLLGRGVALWDKGTKSIYKNVNLLSNQDTYYTGSGRTYFDGGTIHGTVDFICGGGDIFFNECTLYLEQRSGNCITAPATSSDWGYVFNNCTIDGYSINNNAYRLGRPWSNTPKSVYLNTTMKVLPTADAWGDPMNVVPAVFAEYNSMTSSGQAIDLSTRRTTYTKDATTVVLNPKLTATQAATYTVDNVLGGTDAWQPTLYADQIAAPVISGEGRTISWINNDYVLCWAVFKDGVFVEFVTTNSYSVPSTVTLAKYTVRAANEMGGLSKYSNEYNFNATAVNYVTNSSELIEEVYYTLEGRQLKDIKNYRGALIVRSIYSDGHVITNKIMKTNY